MYKPHPIGQRVQVRIPPYDPQWGTITGESRDKKLWWVTIDGKVRPHGVSKTYCTIQTREPLPPSRQLMWRPRRIEIIVDDHGYSVIEGPIHSDHLAWDEMLGQIVSMTIPQRRVDKHQGLFGMSHEDAHARHQKEMSIRDSQRKLRDLGCLQRGPFDEEWSW